MHTMTRVWSKLGEAIFLAPSLLIHFKESLRIMIIESFLNRKNIFGRGSPGFILEVVLEALSNIPLQYTYILEYNNFDLPPSQIMSSQES